MATTKLKRKRKKNIVRAQVRKKKLKKLLMLPTIKYPVKKEEKDTNNN